MATLEELKKKYNIDRATREPNPSCKFCKGTGEKPLVKRRKNVRTGRPTDETHTFCICLFIDHSASDDIGDSLSEFATQQLDKMERESEGGPGNNT